MNHNMLKRLTLSRSMRLLNEAEAPAAPAAPGLVKREELPTFVAATGGSTQSPSAAAPFHLFSWTLCGSHHQRSRCARKQNVPRSPSRRRTSSTLGQGKTEEERSQRMRRRTADRQQQRLAGRNVEYVAFCKDVDILRA